MKKTITTFSLACAIAVSLTATAKAALVTETFTWVQDTTPAGLVLTLPNYPIVDSTTTSSGILTYTYTQGSTVQSGNPGPGTITGYSFSASSHNGSFASFTDNSVDPGDVPPLSSQILPDGNLLVSTPSGDVLSVGTAYDGDWYDNAPQTSLGPQPFGGTPDENDFLIFSSGVAITGDWVLVPGSTVITPVPEASTVVAGALLLLPLGASAIRILRRNQPT